MVFAEIVVVAAARFPVSFNAAADSDTGAFGSVTETDCGATTMGTFVVGFHDAVSFHNARMYEPSRFWKRRLLIPFTLIE